MEHFPGANELRAFIIELFKVLSCTVSGSSLVPNNMNTYKKLVTCTNLIMSKFLDVYIIQKHKPNSFTDILYFGYERKIQINNQVWHVRH